MHPVYRKPKMVAMATSLRTAKSAVFIGLFDPSYNQSYSPSKAKKWLPWQRPLGTGYRQYLHSVGRPLKPPFVTNWLVAIVHTTPVNSNLVPKLVAMATTLRHLISAMSSSDSLTPKNSQNHKIRISKFLSIIFCVCVSCLL